MSTPIPNLQGLAVIPAQAREADLARLKHFADKAGVPFEPVVYVVRLYLSARLPATSQRLGVFVGDRKIDAVGAWAEGVYFFVHDPHFLQESSGKHIGLCFNGVTKIDTGWRFPAIHGATQENYAELAPFAGKPEAKTVPSVEEALRGSVRF